MCVSLMSDFPCLFFPCSPVWLVLGHAVSRTGNSVCRVCLLLTAKLFPSKGASGMIAGVRRVVTEETIFVEIDTLWCCSGSSGCYLGGHQKEHEARHKEVSESQSATFLHFYPKDLLNST